MPITCGRWMWNQAGKMVRKGGYSRRAESGSSTISCTWLHAGVFHVLANMLSLAFIGIWLEQEFGFVRIGFLYLMSGFGGSLLSALFIQYGIFVGASGARFGLLGSMLSELISNWTMYVNKALVYEYMEKGSLEKRLHPPTDIQEAREAPKSLNLLQRLIDYLHNHSETPIVHCDLKPSTVLLDNMSTGHVFDFD
ncbi:unnamed protein product [Malus baccata var. baccata]